MGCYLLIMIVTLISGYILAMPKQGIHLQQALLTIRVVTLSVIDSSNYIKSRKLVAKNSDICIMIEVGNADGCNAFKIIAGKSA